MYIKRSGEGVVGPTLADESELLSLVGVADSSLEDRRSERRFDCRLLGT